jgi:hypothetical protein
MFTTFPRLVNTDFRASHQSLLSGSGLLSVASSNCRAPNGDFFVRVGATVRVLLLRCFAPIRTSGAQLFLRYRRPLPNIALQRDRPKATLLSCP